MIDFKCLPGDDEIQAGTGQITAKGIETIEAGIKTIPSPSTQTELFVAPSRIDEFRSISSEKFDLSKLIRLCKELNICYSNECYFAVTFLTRAILDHVPPIFGHEKFEQVVANWEGSSARKIMEHLQNSARGISNISLHQQIRDKEMSPNKTLVNFSNDLDLLLGEIARRLK